MHSENFHLENKDNRETSLDKRDVREKFAKSNPKKIHEFKIAGVPYRLKTAHDDSTVQELVGLVNDKIEAAMGATKNGSFQNAAVLTALNIAEELILLKRKLHRELERVEEKAMRLAIELENTKLNKLG